MQRFVKFIASITLRQSPTFFVIGRKVGWSVPKETNGDLRHRCLKFVTPFLAERYGYLSLDPFQTIVNTSFKRSRT